MSNFNNRLATQEDIPEITALMQLSILENMKSFLTAKEIEAAQQTMGVDVTLIEDNTYFVIESIEHEKTVMVGCGGWGKRRTLYGGAHTLGRDDSYSDPAVDAARVRAMYTHPSWVRCGVGTMLLELSEAAARDAGFKLIELGATIPGEPLYLARGYKEVSRNSHLTADGVNSVVIKMQKRL
ncbi:GNAT family N-acetyltransferase [Aliiglaciecola sp. LCG003]|uniref:GNAT family N-acetyltransferase n=1 Tax=Aliiglaciecola sp. LCG003 TaxID=3053655 RepID=UPI002574657B|nr:GNAT family N-acetyltransferase [Aliiglaciecola sp. LCG003]WJG10520.1 GNAT family N-acetyltransferase [Aliiglaciecola sp. LCG003]